MKKKSLALIIVLGALNITAFAQQTTQAPENQNNKPLPKLCTEIKNEICNKNETYLKQKNIQDICERFGQAINSNNLATNEYCEQTKKELCPLAIAFASGVKLGAREFGGDVKKALNTYHNANLCAQVTYGGGEMLILPRNKN